MRNAKNQINFQFVMQERDKNQNWGVNDYCRNLSADMVAQYLAILGVDILTFKPFLNVLQFTEQEESIVKTFQTSKQSNMIISSQTKLAAFRSLLETSYLRGCFPQKLEFNFGYPKVVPHRLISLPQTQKCLNLRILVQMFQSSVQTKVLWINDGEENSQFLKKDTLQLFERISSEEKIQIQIHYTIFPDNQPSIFGLPINNKSSFFVNMWIILENEKYYRLINQTIWLLISCQQSDYQEYLKNKKNWELINLDKLSYKGLNPFNWLEERSETIERPNQIISESRDWDQVTPINLSTSQVNSSINQINSSFSSLGKSNVSQILEEKQFMVQPVPLEQVQQLQSCVQSSRQLVRNKVGDFCSFIDGKLLDDNDIIKVTDFEDGLRSYLIFTTVIKGDLIFEREIVMKSKLSVWLRSQMDQFSMACQTQAHEGMPQSQRIEMEQQNFIEEQIKVSPITKIKKTVKEKKNSKKVLKRKE